MLTTLPSSHRIRFPLRLLIVLVCTYALCSTLHGIIYIGQRTDFEATDEHVNPSLIHPFTKEYPQCQVSGLLNRFQRTQMHLNSFERRQSARWTSWIPRTPPKKKITWVCNDQYPCGGWGDRVKRWNRIYMIVELGTWSISAQELGRMDMPLFWWAYITKLSAVIIDEFALGQGYHIHFYACSLDRSRIFHR